jgi:hypothetical protein
VEFTLVYEGPLATKPRPVDKHEIRLQLHPQLKELWSIGPLEQFREMLLPGSEHLRTVGGHEFASIVHPVWHFNAKLHILMLRPEPRGRVVTSGGDIDNRLKTLFDALACPAHDEAVPDGWSPAEDQKPLHCLLHDDWLISQVTVETDRLLASPSKSHVKLIIRVQVHTPEAFGGQAILGP